MYKTKVTNTSNNTIILKEGNAGEYSAIGTLHKDESMIMSVSANATYREYWFAVDPGTSEDKIILTSDDCMDLKEIKIFEKANKIGWTGTPRNNSEPGSKSKDSVFTRTWRFWRGLFNPTTLDTEDAEGAKGKSKERKEDLKPEQSQDRAGDEDAEKFEASGIK
jgi:hypothetical protein